MANRVAKVLRRIGGGTPELDMPEVSQKTRNGYTVLGVLMLIVATMSASVAGFTWASVMHMVPVGIAVATGWFFFSLALNYMMAWIIDAGRSAGRTGIAIIVTAILLFGALISAVNTNFIMLWMLDTEIRQEIQADYQSERADKERQLANYQTELNRNLGALRLKTDAAIQRTSTEGNAQLAKAQADVNKLQSDYQAALSAVTVEVDGRANSKQIGDGSRAKQKRAEAEALKGLLDTATARLAAETQRLDPATKARIAEINSNHASEEARQQSDFAGNKAQVERDINELDRPRDGFINRDMAMWKYAKKDSHTSTSS